MEYPRSPTSFDLPKPETGLAEWTSKIKALQRQVDADEEAEQRRLEEEIAASRMARMSRRRTGGGKSMDLSSNPEYAKALREDPVVDDLRPVVDRQQSQADALHKLTGSSVPTHSPEPTIIQRTISQPPEPPTKPEAISLAAFMGGRGNAPRLKKHAPQQDAHDPTQFEQRTQASAPHPIFGRGGVAMPGMASKPQTLHGAGGHDVAQGPKSPVVRDFADRERRTSTPGVARRYVEKLEERHSVVTPQRTGSAPGIRERTISTPTGIFPLRSTTPKVEVRPAETRPKTPIETRQPYVGTHKSPSSPPPPTSRPYTPRQRPVSPPPSSPSMRSVTTPSLARPIRYEPKSSPTAPQISASKTPSPAFLRAAAPKDPTPSISRLQGRGFVQNMVKASSQLESTNTGSSSPERARVPGERRKSILDRWPGAASTHSVSPPTSPKPIPIRKTKTVDASSDNGMSGSAPTPSHDIRRSLKSVASSPSLSQSENTSPSNGHAPPKRKKSIPERMHQADEAGIGSSSTMISYIKPMKTGEESLPASPPPPSHADDVDELGTWSSSAASVSGSAGDKLERGGARTSVLSSPSRTPLSHPTKDRARKPKPRKPRDPSQTTTSGSTNTQNHAPQHPSPLSSYEITKELPTPGTGAATEAVPSPQIIVTDDKPSVPPQASAPAPQSVSPPTLDRSPSSRVVDRWLQEKTIIGVKHISSGPSAGPTNGMSTHKLESKGMVGRRALPGMTSTVSEAAIPSQVSPAKPRPEVVTAPPASVPVPHIPPRTEEKSPSPPSTPTRHARIPSTGKRATVMDIAQALQEQRELPSIPPSQSPEPPVDVPTPLPKPSLTPRHRNVTPPTAEKRKSSYEKYSSIILPPLREENTPVPSPAATLSRTAGLTTLTETEHAQNEPLKPDDLIGSLEKALAPQDAKADEAAPKTDVPSGDLVHFDHVDEPLPEVDIATVLEARISPFVPTENSQDISVDVMSIVGNTFSAIAKDINVFYETEVLAIVHRSKSKSSGLVTSKVWGWRGRQSQLGEREEHKLHELAKRYGTTLEMVYQRREPSELVYVLGGQLAIRQGTRAHWTSENTAMHLVRSACGLIYIDEHDLNIKNLCSGFAYCLSILDTFYVWYGSGSTSHERIAALRYARTLAGSDATINELSEGESDDDEMFWMMLGDEDYAKADYWQWRRDATPVDPRVWRVNAEDTNAPVQIIPSLIGQTGLQDSVYILDCIWEFFVLVGINARGKRQNIKLAISIAMAMSLHLAPSRPFAPAVHALILPSQLPLDLRLTFRDLDEESINNGNIPEHMNLLPWNESLEHLQTTAWEKVALKDPDMLPLGLEAVSL
ncbi:hypothetical protein PLICRDRAFT_50680 [Plicaturopsis crispa FD-325 SS-3]|nr:hypothetical protein PLICRDRAFT_50680 [Plicaturopsis crispa FD-325 SS-3]